MRALKIAWWVFRKTWWVLLFLGCLLFISRAHPYWQPWMWYLYAGSVTAILVGLRFIAGILAQRFWEEFGERGWHWLQDWRPYWWIVIQDYRAEQRRKLEGERRELEQQSDKERFEELVSGITLEPLADTQLRQGFRELDAELAAEASNTEFDTGVEE